jgi:hypothetical protein
LEGLKRAVLLLAAACTMHAAAVRWVAGPAPKQAHLDPVLARRDECLAPPYTLAHDKPLLSHGLLIEPRDEGLTRELYIATPRGPQFTADSAIAFLDRNSARLRLVEGVESVGLSGCPTRDGPSPCVHLELLLCARTLEDLTADLSDVVAKDPEVLGRQLLFHVKLVGAAGPRCEAEDPRCRPEPYEAAEYDPTERRGLLAPVGGDPQCHWDGECKRSAAGNSCEPWTLAHRPGKGEARPDLRDALCGCVEQHCAWFVQ